MTFKEEVTYQAAKSEEMTDNISLKNGMTLARMKANNQIDPTILIQTAHPWKVLWLNDVKVWNWVYDKFF